MFSRPQAKPSPSLAFSEKMKFDAKTRRKSHKKVYLFALWAWELVRLMTVVPVEPTKIRKKTRPLCTEALYQAKEIFLSQNMFRLLIQDTKQSINFDSIVYLYISHLVTIHETCTWSCLSKVRI